MMLASICKKVIQAILLVTELRMWQSIFLLRPNGGNALVGQGLALYQNNGIHVKVIAGFEPDYLFSFKAIKNGKIYVEKLEYAETDGRCCPSIRTEHILKISGGKAY